MSADPRSLGIVGVPFVTPSRQVPGSGSDAWLSGASLPATDFAARSGWSQSVIACGHCGISLEAPLASISGSIMGDEETESWFYCADCAAYTRSRERDRFHGEEEIRPGEPFSRKSGDHQVGIIRRCERPWDKRCRCDAHREYFGGWLD